MLHSHWVPPTLKPALAPCSLLFWAKASCPECPCASQKVTSPLFLGASAVPLPFANSELLGWSPKCNSPFLSSIPCSISLVTCTAKGSGQEIDHLDFKIVVEPKDSPSYTVILVASSRQEKAAWTSDISQVKGLPKRRRTPHTLIKAPES